MKILLLGGNGWLGGLFTRYAREQGEEVTFLNGEINTIETIPSDVTTVVNFAAKANIDWCEYNKVDTFKSNGGLL